MANLFKTSTPPPLPPPVRMPDLMDPAILEAKRQKMADMEMRGGRQSTILSDELSKSAGKLGG